MPRRILRRSVLLFAVILFFPAEPQAAAAAKPNIIFIMADDLGYGELGCYGQQKILTPHLDRMAREGMRFTRFYAGSTVCAPSRSVLMTGQHTGHTTVRGNAGAEDRSPQMLRSNDVTVAEVLKTAGYRTGLVGKWGLGMPNDEGHPNRQGFDNFFGYLSQIHAHNHFPDYLWRNGDRVPLRNRIVPLASDGAGYATNAVEFAGDLFAEEALDFVEATTNNPAPFFLYYAPVVPHANNERKNSLGNGMEVPDFGPYKDMPWEDALKGHAAMITRLDEDVGRLLQKLKLLGIHRNTLVIFTSDNGPHKEGGGDETFFNPSGPLTGYKRDFKDGGIRVPFIVWWPGKVQPTVANYLGYFGDMMATFAELSGGAAPKNIDSISIVPTLLRARAHGGRATPSLTRPQPQHNHLYFEFHEGGFSQAVIIGGRWKGIRMNRLDAPIEIYDLHTDPAEQHNVAESHLSVVKHVELLFRTERTDSPLWPINQAPKEGQKPTPGRNRNA